MSKNVFNIGKVRHTRGDVADKQQLTQTRISWTSREQNRIGSEFGMFQLIGFYSIAETDYRRLTEAAMVDEFADLWNQDE